MKTFSLGPVVLLVIFLSVQVGVTTCGRDIPMTCCPYFSHYVIPWHWLDSYQYTDSNCPSEGVIFYTKSGKLVCVQPEAEWVQKYISLLNNRKHS